MFQTIFQDSSPDRLEVRTTAGLKRKIQAAAELQNRSATELILDAADREATYALAQAAQRARPDQSIQPGDHFIFRVRLRGTDAPWMNQHLLACSGARYDLVGAFDQIGFGAWDTIAVLNSFRSPAGIYEAELPAEVDSLIRRLGGDRTPEDAARFKKEIEQLFLDLGLAEHHRTNVRLFTGELQLQAQSNTWWWTANPPTSGTSIDNLDAQRAVYQILRFVATRGEAFGPAEVQLDIPYFGANPPSIGLVRFTSHGNDLYTVIGSDRDHTPAAFANVEFTTALTALAGIPPMLLRARIIDAIDQLNKVLRNVQMSTT